MKLLIHWRYGICLLLVLFFFATFLHGEEAGRVRITRERAEVVVKRKNLFIERVLNAYGISFKKNKQGVVYTIFLSGKWHHLERIEIIPQMDSKGRPVSGGGHEIYFITSDGQALMLLSDIRIH